ncbi:hypothetical protein BJ165DRAFT_750160 [Panaeolus papilionaceus]|nr:hypothetical protein BJ165DRAFT_750160 [Panaeolus papilionaceus]
MDRPEYTKLKIIGDISVEPVTQKLPDDVFVYLLLGPTGAGKSCFIQALAGDSQDLGISKDQLAGFTQTALAYRIVNVFFQHEGKDLPIFLIDSPGFSDPKISHQAVIAAGDALNKEIAEYFLYASVHIGFFYNKYHFSRTTPAKMLYLTPVTDTRMPGTKRRTIGMFAAVFEPSNYRLPFTIVTTMWNTVYTEHAHQRAEQNYAQLRDDIFKEFSEMGAKTVRFTNTRESALEILDTGPWENDLYLDSAAANAYIYGDLHERIESAIRQKQTIESELTHPQAQTNLELKAILTKNHRENEETLKKFVQEFLNIGFPPAGCEDAHYHLLKSLLGTYIPRTMDIRRFVLRCQVTRLVCHAKRHGAKWFKHKV